ncbi:hypothetical protein CR511_26880 [Pseudomonas putida]|jgi:RHS repeat-associated protein|nr:hypothetical protein CR511_26880 [Pseudomonas putida]
MQGLNLLEGEKMTASVFSYSAYGYDLSVAGPFKPLGFNAQFRAMRGIYLLGNGYRAFNTMLMRFHTPDNFSPFHVGGVNAYVYCAADPINHTDPSGHMLKPKRSPSPTRRKEVEYVNTNDDLYNFTVYMKNKDSGKHTKTDTLPRKQQTPTLKPSQRVANEAQGAEKIQRPSVEFDRQKAFERLSTMMYAPETIRADKSVKLLAVEHHRLEIRPSSSSIAHAELLEKCYTSRSPTA